MNFIFDTSYPHTPRGTVVQPITIPLVLNSQPLSEVIKLLEVHWPLQDVNFHVRLDMALSQWQLLFFQRMKKLQERGLGEGTEADYEELNSLLLIWLRVVKKMEFYRLDGDFKKLTFGPQGMYQIYSYGNLQSIFILSEIEKYRVCEEGATISQLQMEEQISIFRDVSLKIGRHVLTELKKEMYIPGKQLMMRVLKVYGFKYDHEISFKDNFQSALNDKIITSKESREATIILFTLKITLQLQNLVGLCGYLGYIKSVLLDRSSGMLAAEYDLWTMLYESCLRIYSRHQICRQKQWMEIDQILSTQIRDEQFHTFLLQHLNRTDVSLSSINFYLKNAKKDQRDQLRPLVLQKISQLSHQYYWKNIEDIFEYYENQLEGQDRMKSMKDLLGNMLQLPFSVLQEKQLYDVEYGVSFLLENVLKYLDEELEIMGDSLINQMLEVVRISKANQRVLPSLTLSFRLFNMFLGTVYLEIDHEDWKTPNLHSVLALIHGFYKMGLVCSKATLKFVYHLLSKEQTEAFLWDTYFELLTEHYFSGGYQFNSDLEVIHSHEAHKQIISAKILQKFQQLVLAQLVESKELSRFLDNDMEKVIKKSYFGIRGYRDSMLRQGIQNICLVFSSHLSIQTLEFHLNYTTPFAWLSPWQPEEQDPCLLSLICEEMPIDILKFLYKELASEDSFSLKALSKLPPAFWSSFWKNSQQISESLSSFKMDLQTLQGLQKLRRLHFVIDLANCVFDKLNEHSQKNIKEIKMIYEGGVDKIKRVLSLLGGTFIQSASDTLIKKAEELTVEEVKGLPLCNEQGSLMSECYIGSIGFLASVAIFNSIGKVSESSKVKDFKNILLPSFPQIPNTQKTSLEQLVCKQMELISSIENNWFDNMNEPNSVPLTKDWVRQFSLLAQDLRHLNKKNKNLPKDSCSALKDRLNDQIKSLISRYVLPSGLTELLVKDTRALTKIYASAMKSAVDLVHCLDSQYEEHFVFLVERLEEDLKDKDSTVLHSQILSFLQLLLDLVFSGIRIRSYHLYRVIRYYQKATGEVLSMFNTVIAGYIRLCFEEFITNYKPTLQIVQLSSSRKNLTSNHIKLTRQELKLDTIETACTLSMFVNLFCRLNYASLGVGVEQMFGEQQGKAMYIQYLTALSRRIATQEITISSRDLDILKVDVYGNLNIIAKSISSERLLNKLISLAKHLLRVKIDMKGINKLPVKLLAERLSREPLPLSLQQFEEECKAISLGALSVYRRLSRNIDSNLHLINLFFLSGKNFEQNIDLNKKLFTSNRSKLKSQISLIVKNGLSGLKVNVENGADKVVQGMMKKIERYYSLCLKETNYVEKLYAVFKIMCIGCLNFPQILPLILATKITVQGKMLSFVDFLLQTLKIGLPMFCEFVALLVKTNCGFKSYSHNEHAPLNLVVQMSLRNKLISLMHQQKDKTKTEYVFLPKAIRFMQIYPDNNRFKQYRFVKIHNDSLDCLVKEGEKRFNKELLEVCEFCMQEAQGSPFSCQSIYELVEIAVQKCNSNSGLIDFKKVQVEDLISKAYVPQKENQYEPERRSRECQTPQLRVNPLKYKNILDNILMITQIPRPSISEVDIPVSKTNLKGLQPISVEEELINLNESRIFQAQWLNVQNSSEINKIIVQRFKMFNQEVQSKEFMKDLMAFPTKTGFELVDKSVMMSQDAIDESETNEEDPYSVGNSSDGIIETDEVEQPSCQDLVKFSIKSIEDCQEMFPPQVPSLHNHNSDSIIYSEIQIQTREDGSMKLFGMQDSAKELRGTHREEVTKDDMLALIEDYTLNPEAIKLIAFRAKYLQTEDLLKLYEQQSGQIAFIFEAQIRSRGVSNNCKDLVCPYDELFIDEAKLFDKVRGGRNQEVKDIIIPKMSNKFARQYLVSLLKKSGEGCPLDFKRTSNFIRKIMLDQNNINCLLTEALSILGCSNDSFETQFSLAYSKKHGPEWFKHFLVDSLFAVLVDQRIALPVIFYGWWSQSEQMIAPSNSQAQDSCRVIQMVLQVLLASSQKNSVFLKLIMEYINCLNRTTRFGFPYLDIQDSIPLDITLAQKVSKQLRVNGESFSQNPKLLMLSTFMSYLNLSMLKEILKVELDKTAEAVSKICEKEDQVLQHFRRHYDNEEKLQLQRKAEIYWQLRKAKNLQILQNQVILSRRILTDVTTKMLQFVKENCFSLYYKKEQSQMKEELSYLKRKYSEAKHYTERHSLELEFQEKEKRYLLWKKNLLNLIVVEDIIPTLEAVSYQFLAQIRKSESLLIQLQSLFGEISARTPLLFGICSQLYKIMMAFENAKKQEQNSFHSMALLKTLPSINSTRETPNGRRRSSLGNLRATVRSSAFLMINSDLSSVMKRFANVLPAESIGFSATDSLKGIHAKNADLQTRLSFLKTENKLGQKVIEVSRNSIWTDTYPHLDQSFSLYEIKIKIKGELGLDYGGVTREWVILLIRQITDPRFGLFELNVNELALQPSRLSYLIPNQLEIFTKLGIFVGKALKEGWLLEINFTKSFLKHMLGVTLYVEDLQDIDPHTARSLLWILKNNIGDDLGLTFTYQENVLQQNKTIQLVPGGSEVQVTEANKKQYVKKLAYTKMTQNIREQSMAFMAGVEKVLSVNYLKMLNYKEIGKILSGCVTINMSEMIEYAKYQNCSEEDDNVRWFWSALSEKSEQDKAQFLFFLTGSYRVPYSGFKAHPITINRLPASKDYCPVAHTCFSIIDLPEYSSRQVLDKMLSCAIKEGKGFTVS